MIINLNINNLTYPTLARNLYEKYYIKDATPGYLVSSHWEDFGSKIQVFMDDEGNLISFKGYGFGDLQYTRFTHKICSYLCNISYLIRLPPRKEVLWLMSKSLSNLKAINSYLSYGCLRQIYAFVVIRKYFKFDSRHKFNVMIIGDGYGFLASLIKKIYPQCKVVLVDIGKVLFFQCVNLQRIFPSCAHYGAIEDNISLIGGEDFIYCPVENLDTINQLKFNLIINISSMQEMSASIIKKYFEYIRRNATTDNLFYCSNRASKKLVGGEVSEFFSYPWHAGDIHLVDAEPKFYRYFFSLRYPFIRYFERMHSRLTILKTIDREEHVPGSVPSYYDTKK